MFMHLHLVRDCFHTTTVKSESHNIDCVADKALNIDYLACTGHWLTAVLDCAVCFMFKLFATNKNMTRLFL